MYITVVRVLPMPNTLRICWKEMDINARPWSVTSCAPVLCFEIIEVA